jgi:hypothetical protein
LLFALALYIVVGAGWKLWTQQGAKFSLAGLIVSILAMPIMYFLSRRKLRLAEALGSRALRADAVESITCGWLSMVVVAALLIQLVIGAGPPLALYGFLSAKAEKLGKGRSVVIAARDYWPCTVGYLRTRFSAAKGCNQIGPK